MDVKASARAKHTSSQRGRARHSTHKHHPQQQQQQQQTSKEALPQPPPDKTASPSLPSNWSRYEEDDDLPVDDRLSDVPAVKSKGANYRDLLAEKSMFQASDLTRGRKNLMEAHGRDLWSRLRDVDNIWNIHKVSTEEDNFFTLDLDFISEELAKVDMAERLLVDPKYIPLEERAKHSMKETYDENKNNTFSSQDISETSDLTRAPASSSAEKAQSSSATLSADAGNNGGSNYRWFEEVSTSRIMSEKLPDMSKSNILEVSDGKLPQFNNKIQRVLKDTLVELPKTADKRLDAKSAEAELDALLDMLDDRKTTAEASSLFSSGFANSQGTASQRSSYVDVLQENRPVDPNMDSVLGSSSKLLVGASNSFHDMKGSFDAAIKIDNVPSQAPAVVGNMGMSVLGTSEMASKIDNVSPKVPAVGKVSSSVPNLDDDFDDWLDSL